MKVEKIVNLTKHNIVLRGEDGQDTVVPPSGTVARVAQEPGERYYLEGVPVPIQAPAKIGEVQGLPDPEPGTIYIVSGQVLREASRPDVFAPGTGPKDGAIRDEKGRIVAVTCLNASV